nr:immunoglobulin light chain junction region [Macaca mulatta]MOW31370.1 immunoglobulin light chain junction region [Macaca mulatta]MOW31449.1 immunoglobulin light chain junction region [Macaca mulatta]
EYYCWLHYSGANWVF